MSSKTPATAPETLTELKSEIARRHESISPRLQQVAAFVLDNPNDVALETLSVMAERCGVHPSTIVRFAKAFGYTGASEMQRLFRDEIMSVTPSPSYSERIRQFRERSGEMAWMSPLQVMEDFTQSSIIALEHLKESASENDLKKAIELIHGANEVYLAGVRRAFPVSMYLAYSLGQVQKRARLLDGVGGMTPEQSRLIGPDDLVIAVSFRPYATETLEMVQQSSANRAALVVITDSRLSPVARGADVCFEVKDAEVGQFRSLTASMCLAQSLIMAYASQHGLQREEQDQ